MLSNLGTTFIILTLVISFLIIFSSLKELKISKNLISGKIYKFSRFQL